MVQKFAIKLADFSVKQKWIEPGEVLWCSYAVQKWIGTLSFVCLCVGFAVVSGSEIPLLIFSIVFFMFRRRLGGWHANHFWICQLLSIGTVILIVTAIGPFFEQVDTRLLWIADIILVGCAFAGKPAYPKQVHFSYEDILGNMKRKNQLLLILILFQCICWKLFRYQHVVYSFLGLAIAEFSVLLEYISQKRMNDYESF
jgi:accessory gene regulator protein AgrB